MYFESGLNDMEEMNVMITIKTITTCITISMMGREEYREGKELLMSRSIPPHQ